MMIELPCGLTFWISEASFYHLQCVSHVEAARREEHKTNLPRVDLSNYSQLFIPIDDLL